MLRVGRIATHDQAIKDHVGFAAGEKDLVPKLGLPPLLDDDVGMIFEEGDHFFRGGHLLALEDPPVGLVNHLAEDADSPRQLLGQHLAGVEIASFPGLMGRQLWDGGQGILSDLAGIDEKVLVSAPANRLFSGVEDGKDPLLDNPSMVAVRIAGSRGQLFAFTQPAGDDPNTIGQKGSNRWVGGCRSPRLWHRCEPCGLSRSFPVRRSR